jgi:hypothetical protein
MDYIFLLYTDEARMAQLSPAERSATVTNHYSISDDARARGVFKGASPLVPTLAAKTVRPSGEKNVVTDGPYAETKEALCGYYVIDCADADEAEYWAERLAGTACGVCVEFRALREIPARVAPQAESAALVNA